jgi:hypothetical protein
MFEYRVERQQSVEMCEMNESVVLGLVLVAEKRRRARDA